MSYARARLWLGICGVGMMTLLCVFLLALQIPQRSLFTGQANFLAEALQMAAVFLVYAFVSGPFDFFGGHILPQEYGRTLRTFPMFLRSWLRGVVAQGVLLTGFSLLLLQAARIGGAPLQVGAFAGVTFLLLAGQSLMASLISGVGYRKVGDADTAATTSPVIAATGDSAYFTGGIAGIPGLERIFLPEEWNVSFTREERETILLRRSEIIRSGSRMRGVLLAIFWNLSGYILSATLTQTVSGVPLASVAGVATCSIWFTLWNFVGLLTLPSPSQRGVFCGDAFALRRGAVPETLIKIIKSLDQMQDDEYARPPIVETYFHPIPSVERRLTRLNTGQAPQVGAWNAARLAIYLSWAGGSFLSRAVHCNAGRPDVWVFLPCD